MVRISKEEKEAIREMFPDVCIVRTMKHDSKRHHYYMEEVPRVMRYLNTLRGIPEQPGRSDRGYWKRGVRNQH